MKNLILLVLTAVTVYTAQAQKQLTVAQDGSGNYRTVQEAINAVPDNATTETIIFIKKGVYKEKLVLPESKCKVTLKGEDKFKTILTYDDYASKKDARGKDIGTSGSASFDIFGADFTAINLTFENSAGPVGQAVAVRAGGNRTIFNNCRFLGFQDTIYTIKAGTLQLYTNCYIEGTVDFIFGAATVWFENCELYCKKGGGYVTAASTQAGANYGYVFYKCKITGDAPADSFYLGRPWRPLAKVVFIDCKMDDQIKPEGWNNWGKAENEKTAYYAEFNNSGPGFKPESRASWSFQLTKQQAKIYTREQVLSGWTPAIKN